LVKQDKAHGRRHQSRQSLVFLRKMRLRQLAKNQHIVVATEVIPAGVLGIA